MFEDLFDHFLIFDESDGSNLITALGTGPEINLIDFLNQPGSVFWVLFGGAFRLQGRRDQAIQKPHFKALDSNHRQAV